MTRTPFEDRLTERLHALAKRAPTQPKVTHTNDDAGAPPRLRKHLGLAVAVVAAAVAAVIAGVVVVDRSSSTEDVATSPVGDLGGVDEPDTPASQDPVVSDLVRDIEGVLPNGDRYVIEAQPGIGGVVEGISAGIIIELDGLELATQTPVVGIATFERVDGADQTGVNEQTGSIVVVSGGWYMHLDIYDEIAHALGPEASTIVSNSIVANGPVPGSDLPSFELRAPLRWATDVEIPLQMMVQYPDFVVRRGCSDLAVSCSPDLLLELVPNDRVFAPESPWPGNAVEISTHPDALRSTVFGSETGAVLILDDGYDGVVAVDLDNRTATRIPIGGSAGDQPYRLWLTGDSLVAGWGAITTAPLPDVEPRGLGAATIFVPNTQDGTVWLIDYPGGRIGSGTPTYTLVTVDGDILTSAEGLDHELGFPARGYSDGLVLETDRGLLLWTPGGADPIRLEAPQTGFVSDVSQGQIGWCAGQCNELHLTDTFSGETVVVGSMDPATGFDARSARFSPDGATLAAVAVDSSTFEPSHVLLIDAATGTIQHQDRIDIAGPLYLSWRADGTEVYFSGHSWARSETTIGRYGIDGILEVVELPFGSTLTNVIVDANDIDLNPTEFVPAAQCPAVAIQRGDRSRACSFGF